MKFRVADSVLRELVDANAHPARAWLDLLHHAQALRVPSSALSSNALFAPSKVNIPRIGHVSAMGSPAAGEYVFDLLKDSPQWGASSSNPKRRAIPPREPMAKRVAELNLPVVHRSQQTPSE